MSEPTEPPPPEPAVEPPPSRPRLLPWLTGAGFAVLAVALLWVWQHPIVRPADTEQTEALGRQISALEARVSRLEQLPAPQIPDLGPVAARVAALERRPPPEAAMPAAAPDLGPVERRVTALEERQPPDLAPLQAHIAAVENAGREMQTDLARRIDTLAAHEKAMARIPLVQTAALALAAGQKLGQLPGAPPALARFADVAPPTEAELRLAFVKAAREALAAARPAVDGEPLLARLWARAQDLVTIRQGDRVLVGDPAAGVLEHARVALAAGDLAAAANEVATLQGPAGQAMAAWLAQARSLLDARAALASWAASD
jgi:hypothetical protein